MASVDRRDLLWALGWRPDLAAQAIEDGREAAARLDVAAWLEEDWTWAELNLWFGIGRWDAAESGPDDAHRGVGIADGRGLAAPIRGWASGAARNHPRAPRAAR